MAQFIPYRSAQIPSKEQYERAKDFFTLCAKRRTVRNFSPTPVARELLEMIVATSGTAPSGANKQPWRFVVVMDSDLKREIRIAAEREERENYERRMPQEWLDDLAALGTDWQKEFLEVAPALIVVFSIDYERTATTTRKNYYVKESVGIAVGFLLAAIHNAGLVSLTHTPSPMGFLQKILGRPENERPFLLIPLGYPAENVLVPDIERKKVEEILVWR